MSALNIFYNEVMPLCHRTSYTVDLSILNSINVLSPTTAEIRFSDLEDSFDGIEDVIVKNFAANFASAQEFSTKALIALKEVLENPDKSEEAKCRKVMMLHMSKMFAEPGIIYTMFTWCPKMTIASHNEFLDKWTTVASKIFENEHVNHVIDSAIKEYGVSVEAPFDPKMVKVVWIKYFKTFVRGFSGVNKVYANEKHFMMTHYSYEDAVRPEILDSLMIIDIANLLLHEYAHLKLRKYTNDFNTSSPVLAMSKDLPNCYKEFGRLAEELVFGAAIDWVESQNELSPEFLDGMVNAIQRGEAIQKVEGLSRLVLRNEPLLMALDCKIPTTTWF